MLRAAHSLIVYGALVAASLAYVPPAFWNVENWGRGDWDQFSFRFAVPRAALLRDGQLPLWNPYVNGGNVLAAHPHVPAFSPWYLPALLLGAPLGIRVTVVLFVALGTTGMAALLAAMGIGPAGRLLGGLLIMTGSHFTLHLAEGHVEWCLLGLMPWAVLCLFRAPRRPRMAIVAAVLLASALLHGSVYIVAMFVPALLLWAVLESTRRHNPSTAGYAVLAVALAAGLAAVVLIPRAVFLLEQPRHPIPGGGLDLRALPRVALSPNQAAAFCATRDVRNPDRDTLARLLAGRELPPLDETSVEPERATKWQCFELRLVARGDWACVTIDGCAARLSHRRPTQSFASPELPHRPAGEATLRVDAGSVFGGRREACATLHLKPEPGGELAIRLARGDRGAAELRIVRNGRAVFSTAHVDPYDGRPNRPKHLVVPMVWLQESSTAETANLDGRWQVVELRLQATSDWASVDVANAAHLFLVEPPELEAQAELPLQLGRLSIEPPRSPPETKTRPVASVPDALPPRQARAEILLRSEPGRDMRFVVRCGKIGTAQLTARTAGGDPIELRRVAQRDHATGQTVEYVGRKRDDGHISRSPLRWQLDRWGMFHDWHEYSCYLTWPGLDMAVVGLVVSWKRRWPWYGVGAAAAMLATGATTGIDFWAPLAGLPLVGSLHVPSRMLAVVVFVAAIAAAHGLDWLQARLVSRGLGRFAAVGAGSIVLAVYVELAVLSWSVLGDVFVCPPRPVPQHRHFAQRYAEDEVRYAAMHSCHMPYLRANSGVLRHYENVAVRQGRVRLEADADYRGPAYLEEGHGTVDLADWTMARVDVALRPTAADRLVLNQNYAQGWRARCWSASGEATDAPARPSADGVVSTAVYSTTRRVEFYYRPPGLVAGAWLSLATFVVCVAGWFRSPRRSTSVAGSGMLARAKNRDRAGRKSDEKRDSRFRSLTALLPRAAKGSFGGLPVWLVVLNAPFVLVHPAMPVVGWAPLRALAIAAVLLLIPGLPAGAAGVGRGRQRGFAWIRAIAVSLAVFLGMLTVVRFTRLPLRADVVWNGTWLVTNLLLAVYWTRGRLVRYPWMRFDRAARLAVVLFGVCFALFYWAATHVVPPMDDHDYPTQSTAYALLHDLQPRAVTDRYVTLEVAHPPLLHFYVAGSFLYFDQLARAEEYEAALRRIEQVQQGKLVEPPVRRFWWLPDGRMSFASAPPEARATRHEIVGTEPGSYLVDPPLPGLGQKMPAYDLEVCWLYHLYRWRPARLANRAVNVFLAALTVALLGAWLRRNGLPTWLAALAAAVYASSPEVFVRSSYGGYFAGSNFFALAMLLAVDRVAGREGRPFGSVSWREAFICGTLAAWANHKLLLLPVAVLVWRSLGGGDGKPRWQPLRALLHPVPAGFLLGTLLFWLYGLWLSPEVFWQDHIGGHLVDRLTHFNPLGYGGYPSRAGLWWEWIAHTGYLLVPLGCVALAVEAVLAGRLASKGRSLRRRELPGQPRLWLIWSLLLAMVFTLVDWRQTKHLMPLMLPLILAPARSAMRGRLVRMLVAMVLGGLLLWNLAAVAHLAVDFGGFAITPDW